MAVSNSNEKRKHPRVGFKTQIDISPEGDGKRMNLEGNSADLSLKGVLIHTGETLPVGTHCDINIFLSGGIDKIMLSMKATVVRSSDTGMGIVFESMDVDTYSHLKNIVCYNTIDDKS